MATVGSAAHWPAGSAGKKGRRALLAVAVMALIPRLYLLCTTTILPGDEDRDWIPLASTISLAPDSWSAPIRGKYHGALPAYGIALGRFAFGANEIGDRGLRVV